MVEDAEKVMEDKSKDKGKPLKKTKEMLLRELRNDLEEPWCCLESLAPVKSVGTAIFFFILNFFFPGLGTLCSGLCIPVPSTEKPKVEEDDALEGLQEDAAEEEDEEAKAKRLEEERIKAENDTKAPKPEVVSAERKMVYSRAVAIQTGFAQFLSAPFGLGWMWSISHGMILVENAQIYGLIDEVEEDKDGIYGGKKKEAEEDDDDAFGADEDKED